MTEQDPQTEARPENEAATTPTTPTATDAPSSTTESATSRLEEEGEIAADYLEEFLDIVDLDGDIELDIDNGRAAVEIVAEGSEANRLRRLVGTDGEVLDALQELTRSAVQTSTGDRSRLMLDIAGHRAKQRNELTEIAQDAIARARAEGQDISLPTMNPFERKVVHDAVAAAGLVSDSEGVEPHRRVVIRVQDA